MIPLLGRIPQNFVWKQQQNKNKHASFSQHRHYTLFALVNYHRLATLKPLVVSEPKRLLCPFQQAILKFPTSSRLLCVFFLPTTPFCFPVVEMCIFVYCQPLTIHKSETERGPESSCHGPIYTGLTAAGYAQKHVFFRALPSSWVGNIRCVLLERRIGWIDCKRSLFTPCSWLRRIKFQKYQWPLLHRR